jgi:hypothetical protein
LAAVSKEYYDFAFLFKTSAMNKLPKYKPWNHIIPFVKGKIPSYESVYILFKIELQAL